MPKESYPALNAKQVVKILERAGFSFVRQKGSHAIYEKEEDNQVFAVVVPMHGKKDLLPKTLKSIISQSGMSKKEFFGYMTMISMYLSGIMRFLFFWLN